LNSASLELRGGRRRRAWPLVPLGDLITNEKDPVGSIDGDGLEVLGVTNKLGVTNTGVEASADRSKYLRLRPGRFVYNPYRVNVGSIGLSSDSQDGIVSPAYVVFRPEGMLESRYLWYFLKSAQGDRMINFYGNRGTVRGSLRFDDLASIEIPLPPLPEQRRIVARIEELAAKIDEVLILREEATAEAVALVRAVIAGEFSQPESRGWRKVRFGGPDVLRVIDGDRGNNYPKKVDFAEAGYCLFLNTGNVRKGDFSFARCEFISEEKDATLRKGRLTRGDVVLTTRGTLGNFAYFDNKVPFDNMRINSGMVILRPSSSVLLPQYLQVVLSSPAFVAQVAATLSGSAQSQLPVNKLARIEFYLPPINDQRQIVAYLDSLQAKVDELKKLQAETQAELDALLPSILDKAFKGEL
jgi:type I restriction enzyme, S subunit